LAKSFGHISISAFPIRNRNENRQYLRQSFQKIFIVPEKKAKIIKYQWINLIIDLTVFYLGATDIVRLKEAEHHVGTINLSLIQTYNKSSISIPTVMMDI
jgi:hypothetical protein